ncbi:MAG: hypothetical protein Q7S04_04505 [Candidatus Moranbacteria bacterium]|nr:hypothetical protein [Candidatus Moranbacteria bacterium]
MELQNKQQQYEDIYARALDAIEHWDAVLAWNIYCELEKFLGGLPMEQKQEPELAKEIVILKRSLLAVGFPALPREGAVRLFREHILDFFRVDVDFKERLLTRYTFVGYGEKEDEQKRLQEALLQNQERLGQFTLGEWVKLFERHFKLETRDKQAVTTFLTQTGEVASLTKSEQSILRQILSVYDQYIAHVALDEFDMAVIGASVNQEQASRHATSRGTSSPSRADQKAAVSLPLLQALSKYERLGEQLITRGRIKVGSQTEPVRPSLLYWLKYYRDELGIGQHSSVERGNFLFRSENGKNLSAEERERINIILKSVEENFPLSIDPKNQEIIFPTSNAFSITAASRPASTTPLVSRGENSGGRSSPVFNVSPVRGSYPNSVAGVPAFVSAPVFKSAQTSVSLPLPKVATIGTPAFFVPKPEESEIREKKPPTASPISFFDPHEGDGKAKEAIIPPVQTKSVSFSTSHIFPAEKEAAEVRSRMSETSMKQVVVPEKETPPLPPQPALPLASQDEPVVAPTSQSAPNFSQPNPIPKKLNSFRIRPVSLGGRD